jgi:uncharacterized membrane protein
MSEFASLAAASFCWYAIHAFIAGSGLRWTLARRIGEDAFRGLFSLLSFAVLLWLGLAYAHATYYPLWFAPRPIRWVPLLVVPLSFVLLAGAFSVPNATAVASEKVLERTDAARGVLRITRHPFLWGVVLWAASHLLVDGDVAGILFFGSMLLTALRGTIDIDEKRGVTNAAEFKRYKEVTSNLPFAAIVLGKNRLALSELWVPAALAAIFTVILLHFHAHWFGVPPFPNASPTP